MCENRFYGTRRSGFTLVELLVVIAIIGILVAMLLPAVQAAREAARRISCTNNMKQIALSFYNYADSYKQFPPSQTSKNPQHGWAPFVLPFMEQQSVYDIYHWDVNWSHKKNQPAVTTRLEVVICPSTPRENDVMDLIGGGKKAAPTDYSIANAYSKQLERLGYVPKKRNDKERVGALQKDRGTNLALIKDGLSNTMVLVEDAGRPDHWVAGGAGPDKLKLSCGNLNVSGGRVLGAGWADKRNNIPMHGFASDGLSCSGPCPINCTNNNEAFGFHPGGAILGFADGHVKYVVENIGIEVYAAMITRHGSEVVELP